MGGNDGRAGAAKWIVNEFAGQTAVGDHPGDQLDRLAGRMIRARGWSIYFEYRTLRSIVDEIMRAVIEPAVENRLVLVMIIAAAENELLLYPNETMSIGKAAVLDALNEVFEKDARNRGIDDRPRHAVFARNIEGGSEQLL